jgi:hypothetical protein
VYMKDMEKIKCVILICKVEARRLSFTFFHN